VSINKEFIHFPGTQLMR